MKLIGAGLIGAGCSLLTESLWRACVAGVLFVIAANLYRDAP